jgi:hypothetical protein
MTQHERRFHVKIWKKCSACGWPWSGGYISFGNRLHEPHCAVCLKNWEGVMKKAAEVGPVGVLALSLAVFRDWQQERQVTA